MIHLSFGFKPLLHVVTLANVLRAGGELSSCPGFVFVRYVQEAQECIGGPGLGDFHPFPPCFDEHEMRFQMSPQIMSMGCPTSAQVFGSVSGAQA